MNSFTLWSFMKVLASDEDIRALVATNQAEEISCCFINIMNLFSKFSQNFRKSAGKMTGGGDGSAEPPRKEEISVRLSGTKVTPFWTF